MRLNKLNGVELFVKGKEAVKIVGSLPAHFFCRESAQFADLPRRFHHEGRLITLAAMRNRRQKRRVGFNQHAIQRDLLGRIANLLRLRKSNVSRKRNHEPHIERPFSMRPMPGKTMQNAPQSARRPTFANQLQTFVPCILAVVGWAAVNHNRQLRRSRQFHLPRKNLPLHVPRRVVIKIIQPNLPPGNHLGPLCQSLQFCKISLRSQFRLMGMNSDSRMNELIPLSQLNPAIERSRPRPAPDSHNALNSRVASSLQDRLTVPIELLHLEMCVGINKGQGDWLQGSSLGIVDY